MKKILLFLSLFFVSVVANAQIQSTFSCNNNSGNALTTINTYCPGSQGTNLLPSGTDTHNLYIIPEGTPGTITVIIQGSKKGDFTDAVTCGTSSTTTPNLLSCSGIYAKVRVKLTVFTGFTSVNLTYIGTSTVAKTIAGSVNLSADLPIVVTPNPITGTGTISCPTCTNTFACSSITAGVPTKGTCSASITSPQLLNLSATPASLIAAQGANTFIDVDKATAQFVCNSCTPYTLGASTYVFTFFYGTYSSLWPAFPMGGMVDQSTSQLAQSVNPFDTDIGGIIAPVGSVANKVLLLGCNNTADGSNCINELTDGDGTLLVFVTYNIVTLQ